MDEKFQEMISDIKEIQPFFYGNIAEMFIAKGYRKESDTAREILAKLLNMGERAILNDIINPYECFFVSFDKFKKIAEKYGVDLGE